MADDTRKTESVSTTDRPVEEHFIGLIPDVYRWTRWGGKDRYNIAVTDKRLIFDLVTDKTPPWDSYAEKRIEEIMAFNKKNFSIEADDLKSFQFVAGEDVNHTCGRFDEIRIQWRIQTPKAKYCFYVPNRFERDAKQMLKKAGIAFEEIKTERLVGI